MIRVAGFVLLLLGLGCQTALDVERARGLLRRDQKPHLPALVESDATELGHVEGLFAVSGELRQVPLSWDAKVGGDVAGYVVERASEEQGPFQRLAALTGRFETSFVDRGSDLLAKRDGATARDLGDGQRYFYRVRPFDSEGRISGHAAPVARASTAPIPAEPQGLQAISHLPRQVALKWEAVPDPSVVGYVIQRSPTTQEEEFLPIAELEGRFRTSFVDEGLGDLRVFYYRVAARNAAGGLGRSSAAQRAVTKAEPLPPTKLVVMAQSLGRNILRWADNVEGDLAGYRLLRRRQAADQDEVVAVLAPDVTTAVDEAVGAGEVVTYRLVAFDGDGLESEASKVVEVEGISYGLRALALHDGVELHWDPSVQAGLSGTRVMLEGMLRSRELANVAAEGFAQRDLEPGRYRFRLIGVRRDGSLAPPSRLVEAQVGGPAGAR